MSDPVIEEIQDNSIKLEGLNSLDPLVNRLRDKECVMIGEATHGTSDFYRYRSRLTRKLIEKEDISFIGVEGDWPDCYRINQYVKNKTEKTAEDILLEFERWPTWMWSNWEILDFIEWLREYNKGREEEEKVGFYGLDLYSLNDSIQKVVNYLSEVDPEAAEDAREAYQCLNSGREGPDYAEKLRFAPENCEDKVVQILTELNRKKFQYEDYGQESFFDAQQNAFVAKNAEKYYRSLVTGRNSWNIRDRHMADTLEKLLDNEGANAQAIIWAHNSHVGDSTATDMPQRGEINLGKLMRDRREEVSLVGFSTYSGKVIASRVWGGEMEEMEVPEARDGSYDELLHRAEGDRIVFLEDTEGLNFERGHRAIGVVYKPEKDGYSYVPTRLAERYDHMIFVDKTTAVHPMQGKEKSEEPETYPWGV